MANHTGECESTNGNLKHAVRPQTSPITGPVAPGRRDFFKLAGTGVAGFCLTPLFKSEAHRQTLPTEVAEP